MNELTPGTYCKYQWTITRTTITGPKDFLVTVYGVVEKQVGKLVHLTSCNTEAGKFIGNIERMNVVKKDEYEKSLKTFGSDPVFESQTPVPKAIKGMSKL